MNTLIKLPQSTTGQLLASRLIKQCKEHGKLIIAFDFDDTVFPLTYPLEVLLPVHKILKKAIKQGHTLICYTANLDQKVSLYLFYNGLTPNYFNESPVASEGKIYYNILIDDKCGLQETLEILNYVLEETK